jgi:hypothetical protein
VDLRSGRVDARRWYTDRHADADTRQ